MAQGLSRAVFADLAELSLSGPRARVATVAALSVGLGTSLAIWLRLDAPFWAALSAFVCTQGTRPASVTKAAERIVGTFLAAGGVFLMLPWLAQYPFSALPALFVASALGLLGSALTRHSYAWLLGGITADMVIMGVIADPTQGNVIAVTRCAEIILGSAAALCVAALLALPGAAVDLPAAPGFATMFGANRHVLDHALRTGIAVMLVPLAWDWFGIPGLSQMAISVAAVMAVPGLAANPQQADAVMRQRALHRTVGCFLGGGAGLVILAAGVNAMLPWLVTLMAGVWICAYQQSSTRQVGYVGQQAAFAFILTLVQGWGPPLSLAPGVERLVGILLGIGLLLVVSIGWPTPRPMPAR
jgi:uncharacterized membrane protein YccC